MYESVEQPLQVGPLTLKRRVYLPAHQPGLAVDGKPGEAYIAYHQERARSGVAMQITGATPVAPSAEWADICLWNVDESIVPGYQALAAAVHSEGGHILAQLAHPGPTEEEGREVIGPSTDFSEVSQQVVVPASGAQIDRIVEQYVSATERCVRGNLDGVEISMAHGLLLAAFLSPLHNHREDEYGGDLKGLTRFPRRLLEEVRRVLPGDRALGLRLGVDDLVEGGMTPEFAADVAHELEDLVDYVSIMVGNNNRREARVRHWGPTPLAEGAFRGLGPLIKAKVSKPVALVGRVRTLALANEILDSGEADLVGMVRAHIADPLLIPLSLQSREEEVRPCVGANVCVDTLLSAKPLTCMVNADTGSVRQLHDIPNLDGRTALVVGGGVAGLESARRLALRGATVSLVESSNALGGRLMSWTGSTSRREFREIVSWQERSLRRLRANVRLGTPANLELIESLRPEILVVATGAKYPRSEVPGDGTVSQVGLEEFDPATYVGQRVLIHDRMGRLSAVWLAETLAERGALPILATSRLYVGEGEGVSTLYPALRRLSELSVEVHPQVEVQSISKGNVNLRNAFGKDEISIACDALLNIGYPEPYAPVESDSYSSGQTLYVGDVARPRDVTASFSDARDLLDALV
ncbi:oxidoreductase [Gulosibacter molinativorax]|uniref:NADH:flavin oxidoreductase/NADH oxidase N-terminal domain-containing protein n=1 Tax=Gulosibacter molinativorax TaxID=256821 RepID=A0ABT7C945_9MICO|nr:FAD-dependent oxidoreductase [Gulosibacter molinativorax]MDJ1371161.1 hypothetical protein [Gulosibacter molinativorax]QUY62977.1 Putative N-methylproline demethylase [Gulosibacter molinativorax]